MLSTVCAVPHGGTAPLPAASLGLTSSSGRSRPLAVLLCRTMASAAAAPATAELAGDHWQRTSMWHAAAGRTQMLLFIANNQTVEHEIARGHRQSVQHAAPLIIKRRQHLPHRIYLACSLGPTGGLGQIVAMGVQQRVRALITKGSSEGLVVGTFAVLLCAILQVPSVLRELYNATTADNLRAAHGFEQLGSLLLSCTLCFYKC
jgi:hypothetical protein